MPTNEQRRENAKRKLERQLVRRAERAKRRRIVGIGVTLGAVVVVAGLVVLVVTSRDDNGDAAPASPEQSPPPSSSAPVQIPTQRVEAAKRTKALPNPTTCAYPAESQPAAKPVKAPPTKDISSTGTVSVDLKTTAGEIPLTLDRSLAPCAVNSFVSLAKQGFFTGTECHRLGTMTGLQILQCGDPKANGSGGPGYTFDDEVFNELKYGRGIVAMANRGPDPQTKKGTNGSQFFLVYGEAELPPKYTVFGTIGDSGLKTLDDVARAGVNAESAAQSQAQDGSGAPNKQVKFDQVTVR